MNHEPSKNRSAIENPACRSGVVARNLVNEMVYIRHPEFSSQIINTTQWAFLQLCDGRSLEDLNRRITEQLGFQISLDQLRSTIDDFAGRGVFAGTAAPSRYYRLFDPSPVLALLAPLMKWIATRLFLGITALALLAAIALLVHDWGRFTDGVGRAARERPVLTIVLYYATFIPIALLHELGHALVVRWAGGEVPEVVIRNNAHFAVLSNGTVLTERSTLLWFLTMGTVVDVYIWLALLLLFHYVNSYVVLMFLLPQTIYFLIYSYSIFSNSDYLKIIATWLGQPVPARPWDYLRKSWRKLPEEPRARKLVYLMTGSLAIKIAVTILLIWTFARAEYRVLVLYVIYKAVIYSIGHWSGWVEKLRSLRHASPRTA